MSKPAILIVDDERFFVSLLSEILQAEYSVFSADSGEQALQLLEHQSVNLVLLDILMPGIDGYETCRRIKDSSKTQSIPVIFLTVKSEIEDEIKGFELGAVDYITKPISPPLVKTRVRTHIALQQAQQELRRYAAELEKRVTERTEQLLLEIEKSQKIYEKLHYLANYDQLTQLPNRNLFYERLALSKQLSLRNNSPFALLLIDLDRFKRVNDSLGHQIGDDLLSQVAKRLTDCLRSVDAVSRLGGDEFTIILSDYENKEAICAVADRVIEETTRPFRVDKHEIHISASIGITVFPEDTREIGAMLKYADMAMYHAKDKGKNGFEFYSPVLTEHADHRMGLEKALHRAIQNRELQLHYQPIVNTKTGKIIATEALLRWHRGEHGWVSPEKIISIAEECGLIQSIGDWVLRTACRQASEWRSQGHKDLRMSVNISPRQFDPKFKFIEKIENILQDFDLPAHALTLEITENLILEDTQETIACLVKLKSMGISLSVDDFGTGYSSLSYLRRFPVDFLKIDRSFIFDLDLDTGDEALVSAIILIGNRLELGVIAEGVESRLQLDFLLEQDCQMAQGFYFSKPLSAAEFICLLENK